MGFVWLLAALALASSPTMSEPVTLHGVCEASAAVPGPNQRWVIADDDRAKKLFVRGPNAPYGGEFRRTLDGDALRMDDVEGATGTADASVWITSHSIGGDGPPDRTRLVWTDREQRVTRHADVSGLRSEGAQGLDALVRAAGGELADGWVAAKSKRGGLDIEGLGADAHGALWIGFRGPLTVDGRALVMPLDTSGADVGFGTPWLLDLGGRGVRSLEWSTARGEWLLVAGPMGAGWDGEGAAFQLWTVGTDQQVRHVMDLPVPDGTAPEALVVDGEDVWVVLDEGARIDRDVGGKWSCKKLDDEAYVRAYRLHLGG